MITNAIINFISRDCKNDKHNDCCGIWQGLGLEVLCDCKCHKKKRTTGVSRGWRTTSNAIVSLTQEPTQDDD